METGVSVIIVNHNSWNYIPALLESIDLSMAGEPVETIIVDSGSTQKLERQLELRFRDSTKLIFAPNRGFGAANNVGAATAGFDKVFFLNPDTILGKGTLSGLLQCYYCLGGNVIVGPSIALPSGELQANGSPFPSVSGDAARAFMVGRLAARLSRRRGTGAEQTRMCGYVSGAALLMPAAMFHALGGFDESYFLFHEETDLCRRAKNRGIAAFVCSTVPLIHFGGATMTGHGRPLRESYVSMLRYRRNHYSLFSYAIAVCLTGIEITLKLSVLSFGSLFAARRFRGKLTTYSQLGLALLKGNMLGSTGQK